MSFEPTDISLPQRKPEDTSEGCRLLANDDRDRAEQSDSDLMRVRLTRSADAWTIRAELLERLESRRNNPVISGEPAQAGENDNG